MANETPQQIANQAAQAGFSGQGLVNITAIVEAESSGNPSAINRNTNGSTDYGLAQINSVHGVSQAAMFDPAQNLAEAYKLSAGGTNFSPWTTFNTGAYKNFLSDATGATSGIGATDTSTPGSDAPGGAATATGTPAQAAGGAATNGTPGATSNQGSGGSAVTVDLAPETKKIAGDVADGGISLGKGLSGIAGLINKLQWFALPTTWVRIFAGVAGICLLFIGLHHIGKEMAS